MESRCLLGTHRHPAGARLFCARLHELALLPRECRNLPLIVIGIQQRTSGYFWRSLDPRILFLRVHIIHLRPSEFLRDTQNSGWLLEVPTKKGREVKTANPIIPMLSLCVKFSSGYKILRGPKTSTKVPIHKQTLTDHKVLPK